MLDSILGLTAAVAINLMLFAGMSGAFIAANKFVEKADKVINYSLEQLEEDRRLEDEASKNLTPYWLLEEAYFVR